MNLPVVGTLTVPEDTQPFNWHRYETASAYDRIQLVPGVYDVVPDSHIRSMVSCDLPAVHLEHYYVSSLFSASSVRHDKDLNTPCTFYWRAYDFQVRESATFEVGRFEVVRFAPVSV